MMVEFIPDITWFPESHSGRVLAVSLAFFTAILTAHYTADLVAYLAVPAAPSHIKTLEELTRPGQDKIKPLITEGTNLVELFRVSTTGLSVVNFDPASFLLTT